MSFTPAARPSPADFAARLWACAPAQPAPRAGLNDSGPTGESVDTAMELTRRIRAAARQDTPAGPVAPAVKRNAPSRWMGVAGVAAIADALAGGLVWALHHATSKATNSTVATNATGTATGSTTTQTASTTRLPKETSKPSTTASHAPSEISPDPVRLNPTTVVQGLVDRRAAAWMSPKHGELAAAMIPNSVAWQRDSDDLAKADAGSVQYRNLRFSVKSARVVRADDTQLIVRAQLQRSEYEIVTAGKVEQRPQDRAVATNLTLQQLDGNWRLSDWSASES